MALGNLLGLGEMGTWQTLQMQNANHCFMHNERFIGDMCPQCALQQAQQQQQAFAGIGLHSMGGSSTSIISVSNGTTISVPGKINIPPSFKKKSKVLLLLNH